MPDDPYLLLGVTRDASLDEITQAYRALVQIYHPDRYAEASETVRAVANRRMQALNAAYDEVKRAGAPSALSQPPPPRQPPTPAQPPTYRPPPAPRRSSFVHYVDGSRAYHDGHVAPLGFRQSEGEWQHVEGTPQCPSLDAELLAWFELQQRNADLATRQLYAAWSPPAQAHYAATVGCTQVVREKAGHFGVACPACGG